MKRVLSKRTGSLKKQAEVITEGEDELLWKRGLATWRYYTPESARHIVYYNALYFALRSGKEHRQLRSDPCQIKLVEPAGEDRISSMLKMFQKIGQVELRGREYFQKWLSLMQIYVLPIKLLLCKAFQEVS